MAEPRGTVVGKLIYLITGDEKALTTSMEKARKDIKAFGQELDRVGGRMTTMISLPLIAAGAAALKFGVQMEASQETAKKFEAAMTDLKMAAASLVADFLPAIRGVLDWVSRTAKAVQEWDSGTKRLVLTMAALAAAIGPVMRIMGLLLSVISANPYALLAAAVVTVTAAFVGFISETNRARRASGELAEQLKHTSVAIDDQAIALASEQKTAALLRLQVLEPELALRKEQLAAIQSQLQAEQQRSGVVRNLDTAVGASASSQRKLVLEETKLTDKVKSLSIELDNQNVILTEAQRLVIEGIQAREAVYASMKKTTTATKERTIVEREAITAEEDAALSSRVLAEVILARSQAESDARMKAEANLEALRDAYVSTAQTVYSRVSPIFEAIGTAIVDSADGWKAFKDAAKDAIASTIIAQARLWALEGARAFIPGLGFNPVKGAGLLGLSVASLVVAGIVRALASGGDFTTNGATLIMAGDNPGGREHVSVTPESSPNIAGGGEMLHATINLDGRPIADFVTRATRRRQILVDAGSVT